VISVQLVTHSDGDTIEISQIAAELLHGPVLLIRRQAVPPVGDFLRAPVVLRSELELGGCITTEDMNVPPGEQSLLKGPFPHILIRTVDENPFDLIGRLVEEITSFLVLSQQGRPDGDQVLDLRIFLSHTVDIQPAIVIVDAGLGEDLVFLPATLEPFTRLAIVIHRVGEETEGETGAGEQLGEVLPGVQILLGGLTDVPGQCSDELISRVLQGSIRVACVSEHGVSEDEQLVHTGTDVLRIGLDVLREVQAHAEDRHSNLLQKKLISPRWPTATAEYSSAASSSVWTISSAEPLVALARFSAFSAAILISLRASMSKSTRGICTSQAASYKLSMI